MSVTIFHNPRCGKSRATLALLRERGIEPQVVEYLKCTPTPEDIGKLLEQLGMEPRELMRKGESIYRELNLDLPDLDREALIRAMVDHPILIERPIVVKEGRAAIGRPPEKVLEIL